MFRRSRFSVRPNVGGVGRTAASSQETAPSSQEAKEAPPKDVEENAAASTVTDSKPIDAPEAKSTTVSDGNDPSGDGTSSSAAVQRRKRFSVKPRVGPGRLAAITRTPKSPAKVDSKSPPKDSELEPQCEAQAAQSGAQSPTPPEPEPEPEPSADSEQAAAISADHSPKGIKQTDKALVPSDDVVFKVPPRPPDKEATAVSEKARTLLSTKSEKSLIPRFSLSRLLNDPSDIQRMEKALKLRKMLRQEMRKEKRAEKAKRKNDNEYTLDPSKMTMRDLIRYLPSSNPMSYSLEDDPQGNMTTVSPEKSTERVPKLNPEVVPETRRQAEEEEAAAEEEEEDDAMLMPRIKVAEDGTLILDEESLTVEVKRTKGPNPAEGRDPIFERGSTTTYSSFRPSTYCKPWTSEETDMFFLAISMVGTDFSMIGQLFHNRTRTEIRNKFKKEERQNSWRIDKAFRERRKLDIEYFTKLLEKILEVQANRKKLKSLVRKNSQKSSKVAKSKEFLDDLLDSEEEEEDEEEEEIDDILNSEAEDGEKENDADGKVLASKAGRKRKRKTAEDVSERKSKSKAGEKNNGEDDACTPEDAEAALPEDQPDSQVCEITDKSAESTTIKPAKLSRGGAAKPLLPLGRKWSKKLPPGPTAAKADDDASALKDGGVADQASNEQMNKETPPEGVDEKENGDDDDNGGVSSGDEDYTAKPAKPTRYGRVPKTPSLLNYPVKEEGSASKPERKRTPKRSRSATAPSTAPSSKKSKLITLRASQSESSEDEDEQRQQRDEEEAFVPACLRSPLVVVPQVDETMEELDILGNMSDVLDISQEGLYPNSLCEGDKSETGPPEPCVHQLDLLVDVIDLMSPEHPQVSEVESYNEAARTLLAIGNVSHPSRSETPPEQTTKSGSESANETDKLLEEEIAEFIEENASRQIPFSLTDDGVGRTTDTPTLEPTEPSPPNAESVQNYSAAVAEPQPEESNTPLLQESGDCNTASQEALQSQKATRSRFPKVKPKPNLSQISRSTRPKPQTAKETRPSPDPEPTSKSTAEVEPRPASLETPELPSSETMVNVSSDAKSAEADALERSPDSEAALQVKAEASKTPLLQEGGPVDAAMREESKSQKPEEPTPSEKEISVLNTDETKSKDSDALESGRSNDQEASKAAVAQPQAEESNQSLEQNDSTVQELPESQNPSKVVSRRSRFAKVKPNLQISRSLPSKSQSTKEPSTLSDLESTREATADVKAPPTCSSAQEPGHGVDSSPKVRPNSASAARSKDGPDEASIVTSDCQTVEMSTLSIIEAQTGEDPAVGQETANISPHQDTVTATGSLNSTADSLPLNITKPDSAQESSGTSEANPVSGEAQAPKCTDETLLPKTSAMRRSRLVKPKPNVGRGARQSRQAAVKTGAGQATVLSTPLEGADNQVQAACSTSESLAPAQDDSASSTGANQTSASLTVFPDTLPQASDTAEPFFILSLTEVPLDESPHQPPRAEPSAQHSHAEESAVAGPSRSPSSILCEEMAVATSEVTEHPGALAGSEDTTTSAVTSSRQRGPKGFLSFLTTTSSAARSESRRGRAASRRPNVRQSMPRKRATATTAQPETTQSTTEPESLTMASQASASPSLASTEVSSCRHGDGVAAQEEPTDVSQYFLSDIFTEVNET
ncbi:transcription factor TFIIIB component B'' homolog isoform X2 [Syngnathus typhle]|uniref:transcription factor TFIIIB component B'' homolog isoform X2 n=1 Tax=Syngnathus typhle TaxID=161592 RepID=UPI002A6A7B0C|nr:transcription factor TFIIIB component B'' homolog isoform X2 [Syngnathus typhle]